MINGINMNNLQCAEDTALCVLPRRFIDVVGCRQ